MELSEALQIAISKTGCRRLGDLLDPSHRDYNPGYEPVVRAIAEGCSVDEYQARQVSLAGPMQAHSQGSVPVSPVGGEALPSWMADAPPEAMQAARLSIDGIRAESPRDRQAKAAAEERLTALVNACPHRGCRISCQSAECSAGKGDRQTGKEATMQHCRQGVQGG